MGAGFIEMPTGDSESVFKNKTRKMIFRLIVNYPGVSFNKISDIFEITDSNLRYHLNYLEKNDKISSVVESGNRCYYPNPSSVKLLYNGQENLESYKLTTEQEHLLKIIKDYPKINQKDLIKRSRMKHATAIRNLNSLKNLSLIKNRKMNKNVNYEYVPDVEMKFIMIKGLIIKFLKKEIDEQTFLRLKRKLE